MSAAHSPGDRSLGPLQRRHPVLLRPGFGLGLLFSPLGLQPGGLVLLVALLGGPPAVGALLLGEPFGEARATVGCAVGQVALGRVAAGVGDLPDGRHPRGIPFDGRYVRGRATGLGLHIECLSLAVGVVACVAAEGRASDARFMRRTEVVWTAWRWSRGRFRLLRRLSVSCEWRLWPPWRWRRERWRAGSGAARWSPASGGTPR